MSTESRFEGVGASTRVAAGGEPQLAHAHAKGGRKPLPSLAWISVSEASRLTGFAITTLYNAADDGLIRRTHQKRELPAFGQAGGRFAIVSLLYVPDLLAFRPERIQGPQTGRPSEETLDRLMEAIAAVGRGDVWPIKRGENVPRYSRRQTV